MKLTHKREDIYKYLHTNRLFKITGFISTTCSYSFPDNQASHSLLSSDKTTMISIVLLVCLNISLFRGIFLKINPFNLLTLFLVKILVRLIEEL